VKNWGNGLHVTVETRASSLMASDENFLSRISDSVNREIDGLDKRRIRVAV